MVLSAVIEYDKRKGFSAEVPGYYDRRFTGIRNIVESRVIIRRVIISQGLLFTSSYLCGSVVDLLGLLH